jgi:protein tyrosine phosphatase
MLTAEKEGGQLKCHSYWSNKDYGALKLKSLSEKKVSLEFTKHRTPVERRESERRDAERRDSGRRRANTSTANAPPPPPVTEPPHAIVRKFTLAHTAHPFQPLREITQIHYPFWPDFGAPASPSHLLALVELCNQMQRASSSVTNSTRSSEPENDEQARPALVHCSAGCGRTGTFCTIDSVIDMLKRQRKEIKSGVTPMDFDVPPTSSRSGGGDYLGKGKADDEWVFDQDVDLVLKTVEDFREQRLSMVQSLRQYVLCYETVLEWMAQQTFGGIRPSGGRERSGSDGGLERAS